MSAKEDLDRLEQLRGLVRGQLARLERERESMTMTDWTRSTKNCIELEKAIATLTGEGADITDAKLARSATWGRLQRKIEKALEPWPAAMAAVAEALRAE